MMLVADDLSYKLGERIAEEISKRIDVDKIAEDHFKVEITDEDLEYIAREMRSY